VSPAGEGVTCSHLYARGMFFLVTLQVDAVPSSSDSFGMGMPSLRRAGTGAGPPRGWQRPPPPLAPAVFTRPSSRRGCAEGPRAALPAPERCIARGSRLLGVSKGAAGGRARIRRLVGCGQPLLWRRAPAGGRGEAARTWPIRPLDWHFIGRLQGQALLRTFRTISIVDKRRLRAPAAHRQLGGEGAQPQGCFCR